MISQTWDIVFRHISSKFLSLNNWFYLRVKQKSKKSFSLLHKYRFSSSWCILAPICGSSSGLDSLGSSINIPLGIPMPNLSIGEIWSPQRGGRSAVSRKYRLLCRIFICRPFFFFQTLKAHLPVHGTTVRLLALTIKVSAEVGLVCQHEMMYANLLFPAVDS